MITLEFPDGAKRDYPDGSSGYDVAHAISPSLAKRSLLVKLNGDVYDLKRPLTSGTFALLDRTAPEALEVIRHDCAHVLAQAVQELFPGTQVTIGPVIEHGFYYDFARETPFSLDDFAAIEKKMQAIVDADLPITREEWDRDVAIAHFEKLGERYKADIIRDLPGSEVITVYHQGPWHDLCRGPHLPSTRHVGKAFKLTKLAGAYWRGDQANAQLQRIYGVCFAHDEDLKAYLHMMEEAEKRDHRRLGRAMDLFHLQDEARGQVFWHPKGWTVYRTLESYIRRRVEAEGYVEVKTPQLMTRKLWETSGHWENYGDKMFVCEVDDDMFAVKPMNCPGHVQIFKQGTKSYRDLPLRMAEFGSCHRNEPSGSLHGILRVRGFVQDDGHIFCREDQIESETRAFIALLSSIYRDLGFDSWRVKFSDRPDVRAGSDAVWDKAEDALRTATLAAGVEMELNPGEGAFYGPKLEFVLKDAIGRDWQCGTLQCDFILAGRLGADFVQEDGSKYHPVMLHRAVLGSLERFIGVLIEHYAGAFPLWLAPVQVVVAAITSDANDYAERVADQLRAAGLRAEVDLRNEKISYKIREHSVAKVPLIAVVGRKEAEDGTIALRRFGAGGEQQEMLAVTDAVRQLAYAALAPDLLRAQGA